jgi:DNA-binding Lrp family transcriptional regulator
MAFAYVLITTDPESDERVLRAVRKLSAVKEAHRVYGIYDLIVEVEAESMNQLQSLITREIRQLPHVRSPFTMVGS